MAIKAIVSFTQKLGQPDYGSVGAGCEIELELDSALLSRDPSELRGQLDIAYLTCRQAVSTQLQPFERPASAPERAPRLATQKSACLGTCRTLEQHGSDAEWAAAGLALWIVITIIIILIIIIII